MIFKSQDALKLKYNYNILFPANITSLAILTPTPTNLLHSEKNLSQT